MSSTEKESKSSNNIRNEQKLSLEKWLINNKISEVECIFSDFTGSAKGKIIPANKYIKDTNFSIPEIIFFQTVTGNTPDEFDGLIDSAESDMKLIPDKSTICFLPWATDRTAVIIHDCQYADGSNVEFAPRNVLKRVVDYYHQKNWEPIVAPEMEFFLTQIESSPHKPLQPPMTRFNRPEIGGNAYSMETLTEFDDLLETLYVFCEAQKIDIDTLNHEFGTAQLEVNFKHDLALKLADDIFLFKRACREAAIRHKMYATFMAKPLEDQPGSSMHFHHSIVDKTTGRNIFIDSQGRYSKNFYYFLGGLQRYLPLLMIFFAPNVNSYRRLIPDWSAPTNLEWGFDNRTIGLRVPISNPANTRIENRLPGADTNPYLAIAASLAAGFAGMEEKIEPRQPEKHGNYKNGDLVKSLQEAINQLEIPNFASNIMGTDFVKAFKIVKECELSDYAKVISSWERKFLLLSV